MRHRKQEGFTLIELLIVVAIIGIIAAIAIPNLLNAIDRGKQKRSMADIRTLGTSCEEYSIDNNVYPTLASIAALAGVVEPVYIRKAPQNDGWGRPFGVASVSGEYTICSGGKDGGNCPVTLEARRSSSTTRSPSRVACSCSGPRACSSKYVGYTRRQCIQAARGQRNPAPPCKTGIYRLMLRWGLEADQSDLNRSGGLV
jgi:general secretion pathway protein G